jgi:transcriptional regulator with XRE-family HTH domain
MLAFLAMLPRGHTVIRDRKPTEGEKARGMRLKELRQRRHLTQEKLAQAVGVGLNTIRKWERGDRTPGLYLAMRLALALDVSLDELAGMPPRRKKRK